MNTSELPLPSRHCGGFMYAYASSGSVRVPAWRNFETPLPQQRYNSGPGGMRDDPAIAAMAAAILSAAPIGAEYILEEPPEEGAQKWARRTYRKVGADSWEIISHEYE